jgi:hypothetical protein
MFYSYFGLICKKLDRLAGLLEFVMTSLMLNLLVQRVLTLAGVSSFLVDL